jgi:hypothetical protein
MFENWQGYTAKEERKEEKKRKERESESKGR